MKTIFKHPVKCPVCEGRGIVPGGFYMSTGPYMTSNCAAETCKQCNGLGVIYGAIIQEDVK